MSNMNRRSCLRCSVKKGVLKNFAIFTRKDLCWSLFLASLQGSNFIEKSLQHKCFPKHTAEFLRASILKNISVKNWQNNIIINNNNNRKHEIVTTRRIKSWNNYNYIKAPWSNIIRMTYTYLCLSWRLLLPLKVTFVKKPEWRTNVSSMVYDISLLAFLLSDSLLQFLAW